MQGDQYFIFHLALAELMARGVDVSGEKLRVLNLLLSAASDRRRFGRGSPQIAFPDLAAKLWGFNADNPTVVHLAQIRNFRLEAGPDLAGQMPHV